MSLSWKIGTVFKIPVRLHFTMLLLPLLTLNWMPVQGIAGIIAWVGVVVLLFGSVLLHELGHALTARRYDIRTLDILLTPIGGIARVIDMPRSPKHEIIIAIAGPLVSLSLAALTFLLTIPLAFLPILPLVIYDGLGLLIWINLMLGVFNLIPALPMDGGRVLRGYLALKYDFLKATQIAAKVGRTLAVVGGVLAIFWLESWSLALISGFIYISAGNEVLMARMRASRQQEANETYSPFGGRTDPRIRTWTWSTQNRQNYDPYQNPPQNDESYHPNPQSNANDTDWSTPTPDRDKDVVVVTGGKVEIVSRKDPEDE
ncbi:MAG: site-2 protease family protein [Proteobacteria bacterium]|nr:site-2 protease family protein [Pseudomonadota bacterium]